MATGLAMPLSAVHATTGSTTASCVTSPLATDFKAAFVTGSLTQAHVAYVGASPLCAGVVKTYSLNSYATEGSTWPTSGKQTLVDHQSVMLSKDKTSADLTVKLPTTSCFYQTDLYANGHIYDGSSATELAPLYPNVRTPNDMIAGKNGKLDVCPSPVIVPVVTPKPSATPTPSVTPVPVSIPEAGKGGAVLATATETPAVLPETGAPLAGLLGLGALVTSSVGYIRSRRSR